MGRLFTVYRILVVAVLLLVGPCLGYPQPTVQGRNGTTVIADLMASATNDQKQTTNSQQQSNTFDSDSDMYLEPEQQTEQTRLAEQQTEQTRLAEQQTEKAFKPSEQVGGSQTFFPSFSIYNNPPLGHSRPFIYQQEAAYSQRPAAYRQQLVYDNLKYNNPFRREQFPVTAEAGHGILGSGNFGVIRGGTFYNENDGDNTEYSSGRYNNYAPYLHNNGHGRPSFYFGATNPLPQQHDQFANFRDFADINTPSNPAYSQYVVVYINKNGSTIENPPKQIVEPKNIIERLAMLDLEVKKPKESSTLKKLSESKRKLALLPPEKKIRNKKATTTPPADLYEPLLALS
ncbi:uncharacterized protein CBL_07543 [Carabus blaptoides fortunei]